jgi:hypothetical protein
MTPQTYLIDANTHKICCRSQSDTYSASQCPRPTFSLFASSNLIDHYFPQKVILLFSKCRGSYLELAQLGNEFGFLNVELLELSSEDMIGQIEAAVLVIVINLLVFGVLDLRLGEVLTFWCVILL